MILAHGLTNELLGYMAGGLLVFLGVLFALHRYARKTNYYQHNFLKLALPGKIIVYCLFLSVSSFIAYVAAVVTLLLVSGIVRLFISQH